MPNHDIDWPQRELRMTTDALASANDTNGRLLLLLEEYKNIARSLQKEMDRDWHRIPFTRFYIKKEQI